LAEAQDATRAAVQDAIPPSEPEQALTPCAVQALAATPFVAAMPGAVQGLGETPCAAAMPGAVQALVWIPSSAYQPEQGAIPSEASATVSILSAWARCAILFSRALSLILCVKEPDVSRAQSLSLECAIRFSKVPSESQCLKSQSSIRFSQARSVSHCVTPSHPIRSVVQSSPQASPWLHFPYESFPVSPYYRCEPHRSQP
jgi:hypothetical protein